MSEESLPLPGDGSLDLHAHLRPYSVMEKFSTPADGDCFFHAEASESSFLQPDPVGVRADFIHRTCSHITSGHGGKVLGLFQAALCELWQDIQAGKAEPAKRTPFFQRLWRERERLEQAQAEGFGTKLAALLELHVQEHLADALRAYESWISSGAWMSLYDVELYSAVMSKYLVVIVDSLVEEQPLWVMHYFPGDAPGDLKPAYLHYFGTEMGHFEGLKLRQPGCHAEDAMPPRKAETQTLSPPGVSRPLAESVSLIEPSASHDFKMTANPRFSFESGDIGTVCFLSMTRNMGTTRLQRRLVYALGFSTEVDGRLAVAAGPVHEASELAHEVTGFLRPLGPEPWQKT